MIQVKTITRRWIDVLLGMLLLVGSTSLQAVQEDPEVEAQFKAGLEALQNDDLKTAIQTFSKILDTDPDLHRARLELALAYYRSLRYEDAEKLAQRVLDDSTTPPEVRVTILAFLAQIKRDSEQFGKKHSFTPFVMGGIMHDSNINVGPTNANIRVGDIPLSLTQGSLKRSDNATVVNAGVDHLYQSGKRVEFGERTGMLVWQSGVSVYNREYNRTGEFDMTVASINTGPAVLMLRHWRASLQFKTDYLKLGGGYLGLFSSVNPSITWQFANGELNWDALYTRRYYKRNIDSGREGDYFSTGLGLGRYFNNRRVAATAGGRVIKFLADDDEFGYTGAQAYVGLSTDTYRNGSVYARQRISYFNYDGDDTLFQKERDDWEYRTTLGLSHEYNEPGDLLKNWVVNIFWERTENDSNIGPLYSYERYQSMISLSRSF